MPARFTNAIGKACRVVRSDLPRSDRVATADRRHTPKGRTAHDIVRALVLRTRGGSNLAFPLKGAQRRLSMEFYPSSSSGIQVDAEGVPGRTETETTCTDALRNASPLERADSMRVSPNILGRISVMAAAFCPSHHRLGGQAVPAQPTSPSLYGITSGPDGNLSFTEPWANRVGRITLSGSVSQFDMPRQSSYPTDITAGANGSLVCRNGASRNLPNESQPADHELCHPALAEGEI